MQANNRWQQFYNDIKDPSWPECCNEHQFHQLPQQIREEIIDQHRGSRYIALQADDIEFAYDCPDLHNTSQEDALPCDRTFSVAPGFDVYYHEQLEGDGTTNGQDFPNVIRHFYPGRQFNHCLDWCSGAGFIGFRLLADQLCRKVTLHDAYKPAVRACEHTMAHMPAQYQGLASTVCAPDLSWLTAEHKFDLVVGNPPPARNYADFDVCPSGYEHGRDNYNRIFVDPGWQAHQDFIQRIPNHLAQGAVVLIKNNFARVTRADWLPLLVHSGLRIKRSFRETWMPSMWYLELTNE